MEPIVRASGLGRRFGRYWALRDLSIEIQPGEAVAILGANGAGKSTLLSLLATLRKPTAGNLELFGQTGRGSLDTARAQLGYVGHDTLLDPNLTARENLLYYGALYSLENLDALAEEALAQVGLDDRAEDLVDGFSRGMKQRLSLARALLHSPKLLILDEPFTGLDAPGCASLAGRLREQKAQGRAIALATHQLEHVLPWCDRTLVLHRGRFVEEVPTGIRSVPEWAVHLSEVAVAGTPASANAGRANTEANANAGAGNNP